MLCSEKAALVSIDNAGIFGYNNAKVFFSARDKATCSLDFSFEVVFPLEKVEAFAIVDYIFCWNS